MLESIKKLVGNFDKNLEVFKSGKNKYNEHSTRIEFIDPFFEALGWDISNRRGLQPAIREVIPEDYIKSVARPDYTFAVNGIKKFFVEAKKPSVDILIDPEPAFQARSYGWSAGHFISILTNFEYLLIYDTTVPPKSSDYPYTALVKKYHYTEYIEKWDEISEFISRETLYSGKFDTSFNHLMANRDYKSIDDYFLKQINDWRIRLANELIKQNPEYSLEYINDITQNFINQMVFLRICEDRNLPIYHKLQETIIDPTKVKNELLDVLKAADKKYNSGLFEDNQLILELSDEIILDIIKSLYYPQSPFVFSVIEANILGEIYELFLAEKLSLSLEGTVILTKKKENINRDIVSTPIEIVKIMVKKALGPLCKGKNPNEILEIKVADIASGSGIFLIEVFDYLIEFVKEWYLENKPNYLLEVGNSEYSLPFEDKRQILLSCIFGIDIDPNAVEVAKFSLLLKLLEKETAPTLINRESLLPYLDENIKQGNALIDYNHIQKLKLNSHESYEIAPFNWEFKDDVKTFNVIIGNPPYVTTENMVNLLPEIEYEIYKKKYSSSYKQFDKYFIFIERALEKLESNGVLCYIVPNKFSKIKSGEKLRKLLTKDSLIKEFIDFNSAQLFKKKGVTTYSSILVAQKKENSQFVFEEVSNLNEWWANQYNLEQKRRVTLDSRILSESSWVIVSDIKQAQLINKLYENAIPLGKGVADIFNGIQTSAESPYPVYWFSNEQIIDENEEYIKVIKNENEYQIEKQILRPYFKPTKGSERNMGTYDSLVANKWIIFPYDKEGKIVSPDEMERNYPHAYHYLKEHYNRLLPKQISGDKKGRDVPHANADTWYHYGRIQALTRFIDTPKLIVGILTKNPLYIYDRQDMLIASGGTAGYCAIAEKEDSPYQLEFVQAVLNHPVIEWLTSIIGSDFDNDFHSRGTAVLENIPIIRIDFKNKEQSKLYYNVVDRTRRIYAINEELKKKLDKRRFNTLASEKEQLIKLIEESVSKLYGIEDLLQVII
jgi:hypothetical protein